MLAHGCDPSTTTRAWVQNHFRWIVWTGACFARRIPSRWREFWSIERTLERLLYRHRREIDGSERSALRRIIEKDSAPQQLMVLCVASVEYRGSATLIEVTDGWYSVGAQIDAILAQAIHNGRLRAGDKVACAGVGV
ncbi:nucleic acid-binding protein, partial [Coemansia reversa NRRL 1564]